jgi:hypothetical protein
VIYNSIVLIYFQNGVEKKEGRRRGYNDVSMFAAKTSRKEIVPVKFPDPVTGEVLEYHFFILFIYIYPGSSARKECLYICLYVSIYKLY